MSEHTQKIRPFFLLEWRLWANLTQAELAAKAGMTPSRVSEVESGRDRFNETMLVGLSRALTNPTTLVEPWMLLAGPPDRVLPMSLALHSLRPSELRAATAMVHSLRDSAKSSYTPEPPLAPVRRRRRVYKP